MSEYNHIRLTRELFERGGVLVGDPPAAPAVIIPFGQNLHGKAYFENAIASEWKKSVAAIIRTGRLLNEAKAELQDNDFTGLKVPFSRRVSQMLRRIAGNVVLSDPANTCSLPASWRILYELTKLADNILRACIADGRIHPAITMKDVRRLRGLPPIPERSKDQEPKTNGHTALPAAVELWAAFSPTDKSAILDYEGRVGLAKLLSPKLLNDLANHLLALRNGQRKRGRR